MNNIKSPEELWVVQKAKLRLLYPHLYEEDFNMTMGRKDEMLERLQAKIGKSRDELTLLFAGLWVRLQQPSHYEQLLA